MLHVGNDIVDLHAAEAAGKSRDLRFVRRVFTATERWSFDRAESPDRYLWAVWAAKETAYKALVKSHTDISSSPRRYEVAFERGLFDIPCKALVKTPLYPVSVVLFINEQRVHCIGTSPDMVCPDIIAWGVEEIVPGTGVPVVFDPERESSAVRRAAAKRIAACLGLSAKDIRIRRHRNTRGLGPPMIYAGGNAAGIDLSLSHHGRFAAFAFNRQKTE